MLHFQINKHPKFDQFYRAAEIKWLVRLVETAFSIFIHQNASVLDRNALANDALTLGKHHTGRGVFTDIVLVLARPF